MERPRSVGERDRHAEKQARDTLHSHQCSAVHFSPAPFPFLRLLAKSRHKHGLAHVLPLPFTFACALFEAAEQFVVSHPFTAAFSAGPPLMLPTRTPRTLSSAPTSATTRQCRWLPARLPSRYLSYQRHLQSQVQVC